MSKLTARDPGTTITEFVVVLVFNAMFIFSVRPKLNIIPLIVNGWFLMLMLVK